MRRVPLLALLLLPLLPTPPTAQPMAPTLIHLAEIVADPQTDWNGDNRITPSDEFVELYNPKADAVSLEGWRLFLNDSTPETWILGGPLGPHERRHLVNPPGELNNNGHVALLDATGRLVDEVRYGAWPGSVGVPNADATGPLNEALRRLDSSWNRGHATPGAPNDAPWFDHRPPWERRNDTWWAADNATRTFQLRLLDADRTYSRIDLTLRDATNETRHTLLPVAENGVVTATVSSPLPLRNFSYTWTAVDAQGFPHSTEPIPVHIDAAPPPTPVVTLPGWTNQSQLLPRLQPVHDAGVGGEEYAWWIQRGGNWTPWGPWSPAPQGPPINLTHGDAWLLRAYSRDAYGHVSPPSDPVVVRVDHEPPPASTGLAASGYHHVRLQWNPPVDPDSGLAWTHIDRWAEGSHRTWRLPAATSSLIDDTLRLGEAPLYHVHGEDAAGNHGPVAVLRPDHEGLYPHVRRLRFADPAGGAGAERLYADFDRPLDADRDPVLVLRQGNHEFPLDGTWLSNRTTYRVLWEPGDVEEGPAEVHVRHAWDRQGRDLYAPANRSLRIDRTPPTVNGFPSTAWVNATGLSVSAWDAQDPNPRLRCAAWKTGSAPSNRTTYGARFQLPPPGDRFHVRCDALDWAGNRARDTERTLRVDGDPPRIHLVETKRNENAVTLRFHIEDPASGVNASTVHLENATMERWDARTGHLWVRSAPEVAIAVRVADRVGNVATSSFAPPVPAASGVTQTVAQPLPASAQGEADAPYAPTWYAHPARDASLVAGLAFLLTLLLAWALRRRQRDQPPTPSLARRLLELRRAEAEAPAPSPTP